MMTRVATVITLADAKRSELEQFSRGQNVWQSVGPQARAVLLTAEGLTNLAISFEKTPKRFRWHESADEIFVSIKRFFLRTRESARLGRNYGIWTLALPPQQQCVRGD